MSHASRQQAPKPVAAVPVLTGSGSFHLEQSLSPIFGALPDDACAHWGRLPVLEQAFLESRQNILANEIWQGTCSLDEPLSPGDEGGVLTVPQTIFNLVNIMVGVGALSVPYALKMSGYSALLLVVLVIFITGTTAKWLGECVDMASKSEHAEAVPPSARDFGFLALASVGPRFSVFINLVTVLEVWLALVTFMVMNGVNAGLVWPDSSPASTIPVLGAVACGLVFVPQHIFAYLSLISTFSMVVAAAAMVGATYMLRQWADPYEHLGEAALLQIWNIPRSVGIIVFCFAGHPCFPGVRSSMKAPSKWKDCIYVSFFMAFVYYGSFGFLGYIVFGPYTAQIMTDNLGSIPGAAHFRLLASFCFLLKVQLTVPLLLNAIVIAVWAPRALSPQWPPLRIALVIFIGTVTVLVSLCLADKLAVVASLAGSLLVMITSVLFPALVHLILWRRYRAERIDLCMKVQYAVVFLFGVVMAVLGTTSAITDLMK
mmetsp:Transcript_57986/g.188662  ORF Transcript_57986/g.188662 Transcript_57986/m.188662 type:complete len:486 (+) Transcript_57986:143-1600(+)